jgi:hypothetical protein
MTAYQEAEKKIMDCAADYLVHDALTLGIVVRCPTCRILHAGLRFGHTDHREYCSTNCFRERKDK